jgi:NitT/TauT family transport system ATP-binding protein
MSARVEVERVVRRFAGARASQATTALEEVSFAVEPGRFVTVLGPSGCGKSTLLELLAGFEKPDAGAVRVDGKVVGGPGPDRGMVFQQPHLFPWTSVLDNVVFGPRMAGEARASYLPRARKLLAEVGLSQFADHAPWQLSGGMRQRVALARAWATSPRLLLMDEPFGALDAQTRLSMQELVVDIQRASGVTILFVTHDVDEALLLSDRILVMSRRPGRILLDVPVEFVRPRALEDLVADPTFGRLKRDILHVVRREAAASLADAVSASVHPV